MSVANEAEDFESDTTTPNMETSGYDFRTQTKQISRMLRQVCKTEEEEVKNRIISSLARNEDVDEEEQLPTETVAELVE